MRTCAYPGCSVEFTPATGHQRYHSDLCRKAAFRSRGGAKMTPPVEPEGEQPPEPEVQYLRREVQRLRRVEKQIAAGQGWQQELIDQSLPLIKALPPAPKYVAPKRSKSKHHEDIVMLLSDTHIGQHILPEETGIGNYNLDIAIARLEYYARGVIKFATQNLAAHDFETLHLWLLGDLCNGMIHDAEVTNQIPTVLQVYVAANVFAQLIRDLAAVFPRIKVVGIVGNHGRMQAQPTFRRKWTDFDWMCLQILASYCSNLKNVEFDIPFAFIRQVDVRNHPFTLIHGDGIKGALGIPLYGIKRRAANLAEILATPGMTLVMGHFHEAASMKNYKAEMIVNGNLVGVDEYSLGLGLASEPVQRVFGVHDRFGKTWTLDFNLRHAAERPTRYAYDLSLPPHLQLPA